MVDMTEVSQGIFLIDIKMWSIAKYSSVYLIKGEDVALFETGFPSSAPLILEGIDRLGIKRDQVSCIIVSHVHLDHAGGAGMLAGELPRAKILAHPAGIQHLIDPSRLLAGARKALGELGKAYELEDVLPIKKERAGTLKDGEIIDLGDNRKIKCIFAPGHAKHEICIYDETSKGIFPGDALGLYFPQTDALIPTTPPPDFDLGICINTINSLRNWQPKTIFFSHFGPLEPAEKGFDRAGEKLIEWNNFVRKALEEKNNLNYAARKLGEEMDKVLSFSPGWLNHQQAELFVQGYSNYFKKLDQSKESG